MSALANHSFAKMNGIGNEIVVVDLRDQPAAVTAEEARAVASPAGEATARASSAVTLAGLSRRSTTTISLPIPFILANA